MTDEFAERLIKRVLHLREKGFSDDDLLIEELKKEFSASEDGFHWMLEMVSTGAFRASIMSSGSSYPSSNLKTEDDPILRNAFRLHWIELKGEEHYNEHYQNQLMGERYLGRSSVKKEKRSWFKFWRNS